ncbi:putative ribonuclease H-like domain-containing protein [Tanacetum coccineum]|uniref:Ribonuclease H-like domain-containing protein n=1 Tax=Tanacetum coccineum TaxID=301880 RepID=A0ABQ5AIE7_9ASTR
MNYHPVSSKNQANKHAGPKEGNHNVCTEDVNDTGDSKKGDESAQDYFVLPIWSSYSLTVKSSKARNAGEESNQHPDLKSNEEPVQKEDQVFLEELKRLKRQEQDAHDAAEALRKEFEKDTEDLLSQAGAAKPSGTNTVNTASTPVSTASPSSGLSFSDLTNVEHDDSEIPPLEEIYENPTDGIFTHASYDDEGAVADFTNLETVVNVSPIPTSRINSIHPSTLILGDPKSVVQTRSMVNKSSGAHAFEELLQFKIQKVWILVYLPHGKKAIGTKWVYRNKKDERGIVVRNKARLVAQGHRQEEGIDYDEVFAHVARIEAIRIFLAFASYMGFIVYKMDVKSAFLYGKIDEEDKYVAEILKKFDFVNVKTASTPIETQKPLVKDDEASDVDVYLYRSMIGSLMYLTASRPDIMFAVCACSRFQVPPKTSHLHAVKRIFRYLKGKPKLGLWYPRVSSFDLEAYSDSDYAGANLDRKSTTGEAEYCCKLLWASFMDSESNNPVYHSKTKHIAIRHHFIRDAYEKKLIQVLKIHTDDNVADLLTKAFDFSSTDSAKLVPLGKDSTAIEILKKIPPKVQTLISHSPTLTNSSLMAVLESCPKHNMVAYLEKNDGNAEFHEIIDFLTRSSIHHALTVSPVVSTTFVEQFWMSAKSKIINNVRHITAKRAGKPVSISEASIRSDLLFDDADGIDSLPNQAIFDAIQLMGYEGDLTILTFNKAMFSPQWRFLFHTMNHCLSLKSTSWDQIPTNIATVVICLTSNQKYNFSKLIFDGMLRHLDAKKKFVMYPRFISIFLDKQLLNVHVPLDHFPVNALTSKVFSFMVKKGKHFSGKVTPLFASMLVQPTKDEGATSERPSAPQPTPSPPHPSEANVEPQPDPSPRPSPRPSPTTNIPDSIPETSSGNHGGQSSSDRSLTSTEGDMTLQSVYDLCISLCSQGRKTANAEPSVHKDLAFDELADDTVDYMESENAHNEGRTRSRVSEKKEIADDEVSTKDVLISIDKEEVSIDRPNEGTDAQTDEGVELKDVKDTERPRPTSTRSLLTLKPLPKIDPKDKGKKQIEEEDESDSESNGIPEAEKKFKQLAGDKELARKRSEAIRNRPPTKNQLRNQMMTYLKHVGNFKHSELKSKKFEEIQALYEKIKRSDEDFIAIGSAKDERMIKKMNEKEIESSKDDSVKEKVKEEEGTKKRKSGYIKMKARKKSKREKTDSGLEEEKNLKTFLQIVPNEDEEFDYEILDKRYPIIDWESKFYHLDSHGVEHIFYRIFRSDGSSRWIKTVTDMVLRFDRMDFEELCSLVMKRFHKSTPKGIDLILWGDLRTVFGENTDSDLWKNQKEWILKSWNFYGNCGVHILVLEDDTELFMLAERRYLLIKETLEKMMDLKLVVDTESDSAYDLLRFIQKQIDELGSHEEIRRD